VTEYEIREVVSTIVNQSSYATTDPSILINTTKVSNCIPNDIVDKNTNMNSSTTFELQPNDIKSDDNKGICKILSISDSISCLEYNGNKVEIPCELNDTEENQLELSNFGENGRLLADTKFDQQYSLDLSDPINKNNKFRVTMDFEKHTQGDNSDINSPRLEIVREDLKGNPDMSAAKNQEIVWQGNIHEYFEEPKDKFDNETYIALQFNTGRHGSNEDNEERGFGVLFDVSGSSNPNLLEYRDNGKYVKYDYNTTKEFALDGFIFHQLDHDGNPKFINNLTNRENVELKVRTFLTDKNTRTVETFVDNGSGTDVPYWTLSNLTKLKDQEEIDDEKGFMETVNQGSGYVIARTDNIDTRPSSFKSFAFNL
jgi:hypothetical protein